MRVVIVLWITLSSIQYTVAACTDYLACTGYSGIAEMQSQIPLENRTITAAKSPVNGSISVSAKQIEVEGIPLMSGTYDICQNSDQSLLFSPACYPGEPDKFKDLGVLNKVTGIVRYHVGDVLFILTCPKAEKVVK